MGGPVRIFSYLPNPRLWKATIAGRLCDVEVEVRGASPDELKNWLWDFDARPITDMDLENLKGLARRSRKGFGESFLYKTDRFLEAQPFGNVPAAFSADGKIGVFESNSIMRLVARLGANRASLMGNGPFDSSRIDSFLDAGLMFGHDTQRYLLALRSDEISASAHSAAQLALANYLTGLERALTRNPHGLVGAGITLADICFVCELALLTNEQQFAETLRSSGLAPVLAGEQWAVFPRTLLHFDSLVRHPAFSPDLEAYRERFALMR
ncbi:glutathione S-transferase [Methylocapsa sp. S129]|uniref:glutathione S-transferase n=1 Tax=Methylocapsa sp. S129 TaxID=1641869 RepID=UPI00131BA061|nr:glutathione S-transferase [Methylocapsa sp. S129]